MQNMKQIQSDFSTRTSSTSQNVPQGKNLPEIVNSIVYVRQLEAKVSKSASS